MRDKWGNKSEEEWPENSQISQCLKIVPNLQLARMKLRKLIIFRRVEKKSQRIKILFCHFARLRISWAWPKKDEKISWGEAKIAARNYTFFIFHRNRAWENKISEKITSNDLRLGTESGTVHNVISQIAIANIQDIDDERIPEFHDMNKV